jgi:small subunit ribosomal protein S20
MRSSEKRRERNRLFRASARTYVKKTRQLLATGNITEAEAMLNQACSTLDKAARKGIIHDRNASRRKGRLMAAFAAARAKTAA